MSITIIRADVGHAATIATIGKRSFRAAFGHLFQNREDLFEYLERTYNPVKLFKSLKKKNNVYYIALQDNRPIGFAKVKINSLNQYIESIAQMELQKIYVLPDYQRSGAGTALLNEVKSLVQQIQPDYLWLDTHISNELGVRFYERNGFEKIGRYFFTIGNQTFEYHAMGMPVSVQIAQMKDSA
jgi:diamine N-acetyltransferase